MLLSIEKRFLFVHVPKTGGTSVAKALDPWVVHPPLTPWNKLLSRFRLQRDPAKVRLRVHGSLADAYAQLPQEFADSLFKFAFVRNPFSFDVAVLRKGIHQSVKVLGIQQCYFQQIGVGNLFFEIIKGNRTGIFHIKKLSKGFAIRICGQGAYRMDFRSLSLSAFL